MKSTSSLLPGQARSLRVLPAVLQGRRGGVARVFGKRGRCKPLGDHNAP